MAKTSAIIILEFSNEIIIYSFVFMPCNHGESLCCQGIISYK